MSLFRIRLRRPQYRLRTLFIVVAVLSAPLAFWASREHQYRVRAAALGVLQRESAAVSVEKPSFRHGSSLDCNAVLRRADVVVDVDASMLPVSDEEISAI